MKRIITSIVLLLLLTATLAFSSAVVTDRLQFESTTFYYNADGYELKLKEKVSGLACIIYDADGKYVAGDIDGNGNVNGGDRNTQRSDKWDGIFKIKSLAVGSHTLYIYDLEVLGNANISTSKVISVADTEGLIQTVTITILDENSKVEEEEKLDEKTDEQLVGKTDENVYDILNQPTGAYTGKGDYTIRIDADYDKFVGLVLDGIVVDPSNYTTAEGSTIITLKEKYLKTISNGSHTVRAEFTDGYTEIALSINIIVKQGESTAETPKTGDNSSSIVWSILGLSSIVCIGLVILKKRNKAVEL